jgi:S1-C subfamily serine protease
MSTARVLCPACNREYTLAPGIALNNPSLCPYCGKTDVPMFLHELGGSNRLAITVALGCLGAAGLVVLGIVALAAVWFLHASPAPRHHPQPPRVIPEPADPTLPPLEMVPPRIAVEIPQRLAESPPEESFPGEVLPHTEREPAPRTPADDQPPGLEPRAAPEGSTPERGPPAASPATQAAAVKQLPDADHLRYGWPKGDSRHYTFRIEATVDEERVRSSGSVIYTVISTADEMDAAIPPQEGTGSAFVVTAEGHLVTSAHVVTGATEVQVHLGDATYPASILAADQARDLAILKIQADDLQPLSLGESSQVQLAQEIRVAGYPLSEVLGTSLKVTRGIVAGFIDQDQEPLLQIDAGINPGNSGGPVLNATGRVIGVASAKLSGEAISNVGFAVPVDAVKRLLDAHDVPTPRVPPPDQVLEGTELARRVTPGVALLRVRTGPGGFAAAPRLGIRFSGSVTTRNDPRGRYRREPFGMRLPPMPPVGRSSAPALDHGELVLDVSGEVLEADGEQSLPFLLGPLAAMAFEPLGTPGQTTWQTHRTTGIRHLRRPDNRTPDFFRPPRIRLPSPYGPRHAFEEEPQESVIAVHSAIEHVRYAITETAGEVWTIEKSYRLETVDAEATDDAPLLSLIGDGRIRFDRAAGAPIDQDFKATLTVARPDASLRIPVTFHYQLFTPQDLASGRETQPFAGGASEQSTTSAAENRPPTRQLTTQEVAALADDLQGEDLERRRAALTTLATAAADPAPPAVTQRLLELLSSEDLFTRITATRAMARWGNPEAVPALIQKLDDPNVAVRQYAVDALIAIGDPSGAEALVDRWKRLPGMGAPALIAMGTAAEPAALRLLAHKDPSVRADGCRILAKIGTRDCTAPLEQRTEDSSPDVQRAARDARKQVRERLEGAATE